MPVFDITSLPHVPMGCSPPLCLLFLRCGGEGDASLLGLIMNGARHVAIGVDAITVDTSLMLISDNHAYLTTSLASAVSLYTNLLLMGIRLLVVAVPTSTAALPAVTAAWAHSILSACMSALL